MTAIHWVAAMVLRIGVQLAAFLIATTVIAAFPNALKYMGMATALGLIGASIPAIWAKMVPLSSRLKAYVKSVVIVLAFGLIFPFLLYSAAHILPMQIVAVGSAIGATAATFCGYFITKTYLRKQISDAK